MTSGNWLKGMVAGFVATTVLSTLMLMKTMMGVMPELNLCLSETQYVWPFGSNWLMLTADGWLLQTDLVRSRRAVPIAGIAAG